MLVTQVVSMISHSLFGSLWWVGCMHELVRVGSVTLADSPMLSSHHSHACILVAALAHECLLLCLAHSNACGWLTHMVVECPAYN
jgi:hypothetical protein